MHQRKVPKLKEILHSIPIPKDDNKRLSLGNRSILNYNLRYLSSGIPLACIMALLLLSIIMINPNVSDSYALSNNSTTATAQDTGEMREGDNANADDRLEENADTLETLANDTGKESTKLEASDEAPESNGISTLSAENPVPVATLNISGDLNQITPIGSGETAYRSHTIIANLQDVTSYALQISYANGAEDTLKYDDIATSNAIVNGANNKTGNAMDDNTWGYAWSDNTTTAESGLVYQTMPAYGSSTTLKSESTNIIGSSVITKNITGKLVFAAKFGNQAPSGHYKTQVLLSLVATPKIAVGFGSALYMQDMTTAICNGMANGTSGRLNDIRDNNEYVVAKLDDGKCWMTSNLRLVDKEITSTDSDVTANYVVPANGNSVGSGDNIQKVYYYDNETNGAYYSWCAATAGTCSGLDDGAIAPNSICPKGWRLPTKAEYGNTDASDKPFTTGLLSAAGIMNDSMGVTKIMESPYNFVLAGRIIGSTLSNVGSSGQYWSSTTAFNTNIYGLIISTSNIYTGNGHLMGRTASFSIRCIAR